MSAPSFAFPVSLSEKYRPRTVAEFVGLDKPKRVLAKFASAPYPSAWLFVGPSGVGKTSMAQALCSDIKGELTHIPSQKCNEVEFSVYPMKERGRANRLQLSKKSQAGAGRPLPGTAAGHGIWPRTGMFLASLRESLLRKRSRVSCEYSE